jgi:hypothetical protein
VPPPDVIVTELKNIGDITARQCPSEILFVSKNKKAGACQFLQDERIKMNEY